MNFARDLAYHAPITYAVTELILGIGELRTRAHNFVRIILWHFFWWDLQVGELYIYAAFIEL